MTSILSIELTNHRGSNLLGQFPLGVLGSLFVEQERTVVGDGSDGEGKVM